ncbi:MAG: DnaB-like helicase C-terminal domain-containing protein, partial [Candidatus Pacearchaeota archaeon]
DKILKIEYVGKEQTYDLTIPVYHNFIANDICVHNTWILIETAIQALMRKYKVLFISLEMNARSIIKRVTQNLFSETAKEEEYMYPRFVKNGDMYEIDNSKIEKGKGLKLHLYDRKLKAFLPQIGGGDLRICCYPAYSADYKKIFSDIELLEVKSGWLPDFIIIDYADLIAPESQKGDRRDQIDLVWKRLRALAQMKNCSVITATHSNKQTFERNIKQNDLSDDNRKINHVGKMISLNQTFSEKKIGAMRMQMIAERNGFFDDTEVVVLQSLNIGKPFLDALYKDKIEDYTEKYQKKS